jgi:hypothetical protein
LTSSPAPKTNPRRTLALAAGGLVLLFGAIQLVPYRLSRTPAPANHPFRWNDPAAEAVARAACYDCHSSQTKVWWAVQVAPFSWLARHDVDEAKENVDFSNWNGRLTAARLRRSLDHGMPPLQYTVAHPEARITQAQKETLVQGFQASLQANAVGSSAHAPLRAGHAPAGLILAADSTGDAESIITAKCSSCHSPRKAMNFHTSNPDRANRLIDSMVRRGAKVTPAEARVLAARFTSQTS